MNAEELRSLQKPLKDGYRDAPEKALVTLRAQGRIGENVTCKVQTGKALVEAGLHPATGGTGLAACSGDMLLEALVACAGVTLCAVATALGIELRDGTVRAEGDLDFRGNPGRIERNSRRVPEDSAVHRARNGRVGGTTRHSPQADRALLRGLPDPPPATRHGDLCALNDGTNRFLSTVRREGRRAWTAEPVLRKELRRAVAALVCITCKT